MNILHIIDHYRIGGPGKTIINTCKYIDGNQYKLHVGSFISDGEEITEFSKEVMKNKIPYLPLIDNRGFSNENFKKIKHYIKKHNIDIIHCHDYKTDLYGVIIKIFLKKIKVVTTHHGWIGNALTQRILSLIALKLSFVFDGIVTVSYELSKLLSGYNKNKKNRVTIHNGIVYNEYQPNGQRKSIREKYKIKEGEILFGAIGRLSPEKGCIELIEAFDGALKEIGNIKLIFVGEGWHKKTLVELVNKLNIENKVIFAGYRNPVQPYIEALDVLVCPSHTEGLSNAILEGFAFRKPVIATNVGGNPEIIDDMTNGLLVEPKSKEKLVNAMKTITQSKETMNMFSEKGYETIINKFDFMIRTKKIQKFYDQLLF